MAATARPLLPYDAWPPGITQAATPANDNAMRSEVLAASVLSIANTEPGSPSDNDLHIIGTAWAAYPDEVVGTLAYFLSGTWYFWEPFEGLIKNVAGALYEYTSGAWAEFTVPASGSKFVSVAMSDMTTDITTGTAKAAWFAPEDGELVSVYIGLHDPSSSGVVRVDMNDAGGSVFTTRPAIDATEATSLTGTDAVLDGTVSFVRGDKFTFDIDDAGTDAKGLQVCVEYLPA